MPPNGKNVSNSSARVFLDRDSARDRIFIFFVHSLKVSSFKVHFSVFSQVLSKVQPKNAYVLKSFSVFNLSQHNKVGDASAFEQKHGSLFGTLSSTQMRAILIESLRRALVRVARPGGDTCEEVPDL